MSSSLAGIDEVARRQYEQAWRAGRPESINRFLPAVDSPQYLPTLEELVHIEIEMTWKAWKAGSEQNGQRALPDSVEVYLERYPQLKQDDIIQGLIEEECRAHKLAGHRPHEDDYGKRFPQLTMKKHLFTDNAVQTNKNLRNASSTLQAGSKLGRYQLTSEHSRGSFGIVWKADDLALGRSVALKQLKDYLSNRAEYRHRFFAEAKITAQLQHPGIVPIHEIGGEDEGFPFYTMNMVGGETLAEAIANYHQTGKHSSVEQSVEWQRLMNAYLTVVRTMAFAHARHILHRDLKPANIILGKYGETLILDWGLAKVVTDSESKGQPDVDTSVQPVAADVTQPGSIIGTPAYMSPEQAAGNLVAIRPSSDVYSLGVILYELLTGQRPFQGDSARMVEQLVQAKPIAPPSLLRRGIARQLEAICLKAIAHNPSDRYAHADLLRADLELYLADEPVEAYPEPWWMRAGRWIRRHKALATGTTVAMLLLLIGSIVGYFLWSAAELKQQQEAYERLVRVRSNVTADEEAAALELKASHYDSTVHILSRAVRSLQGKPELIDEFQKTSARRDRLKRIAEFTRLADLAEEHAAMDRDEASVAAAEKGLAFVSVLDHMNDWWLHLPVNDLDPEQVAQVREDVSRVLLLLSLQRAKLGILSLFKGKEYFEKALSLLPAIQNYHQMQYGGPAHSGLLIEQFCYMRLGKKDRLRRLTSMTPHGPADHFFLGMAHFWLASLPVGFQIESMLPPELANEFRNVGGLDHVTPADTALSLFRMASTLEPRRYWTFIFLGWGLLLRHDYEGAAQIFSNAITFRPQMSFAYIERAGVLFRNVGRTAALLKLQPLQLLGWLPAQQHPLFMAGIVISNEQQIRRQQDFQEITLQRIMRGLENGIKHDPFDAPLHFLLSRCWRWLADDTKGLRSFETALTFSIPRETLSSELYEDFIYQEEGKIVDELLNVWQPLVNSMKDAGAWSTSAMAFFRRGRLENALTCVDFALKFAPEPSCALAVRGHVYLKQNKLDQAIADLKRAQAQTPDDFLVIAGLARIDELSKNNEQALKQYLRLEQTAKAPWQRVEGRLGQVRVLKQMGQETEARSALKGIEEIAPRTTATVSKKLFPATPAKTNP